MLHYTLKRCSMFALWSIFSDITMYLFRCHGASFWNRKRLKEWWIAKQVTLVFLKTLK